MREVITIGISRFTALFRRRRLDDDLDEELRSHLEMGIERNLRQGMSEEEARHRALLDLGGLEQTKERYRDQRGLPLVDSALQDLRFGFRILRRSPGFSILAILCLTLGIGANAAVFSWIEGVLFRPFPLVVHQERLLAVVSTSRGMPGHDDVSWPDFLDLQKNSTLIDAFIAEKIVGTTLNVGDRAERATGSIVSANYFDALGIRPMLGRGFQPSENTGRNAHAVTVISYRMWQDRFRGDPAIIGKTQMMNGVRHTIVGVAPEGFYGTFVGYAFQFWVPASMQETFETDGYKLDDRGARWIEGFVRLKPGVSRQQAQQELSALANRLEAAYPETNRGRGIQLYPLWETPFNNAGALAPTLGIALGIVVFVLLIATANVGNLLLVRSFARRQEMTVRMAVGAGRGRLLKQLFMEGLILSTFAAAGGLIMAYWSRNLLVRLIPWRGTPMYLAGALDWRVFALSAGVGLLSTLLFTLVPAMHSGRIDLAAASESRRGKCRRCARKGLGPVQPGTRASVPEFYSAGGGGPRHSRPAQHPNRYPRVQNRASAGNLSQSVRCGLRFSESEEFSRRANGSSPRRFLESKPPLTGASRLSVIARILPPRSPSTVFRRHPTSSLPPTTTR